MDCAKKTRRHQAIPRHRKQHTRLAQHHDQQHGSDSGDCTDIDDAPRPRQALLRKCIGNRSVDIDLIVRHHTREDCGYHYIENRADD